MRHFIRGYYDGDGCFSVTKRKDRTENSLIYQFNITGMENPLRKMQEHYYLYQDATIYLQRKYNKYKEYCISAE